MRGDDVHGRKHRRRWTRQQATRPEQLLEGAPRVPAQVVVQDRGESPGAEQRIWLAVNGQVKQNADLSQMIWSVAEQISRLSEAFELMAGDIIYSGTPENVGPVVPGDVILCKIEGLPDLSIRITPAQA